jgi:outer membrane lipoprotein LolB
VPAALLAGLMMVGCATAPRPESAGPLLTGRLLVKVPPQGERPAESHNATFELTGDDHQGQMRLMGPLGAQVALATWGPAGAALQDAQGTQHFASLAELAEAALGQPVPLNALLHWLQGQPWPGAPHAPLASATGFSQLGWAVDLAQWQASALVEARRLDPPGVSVRAKLDR